MRLYIVRVSFNGETLRMRRYRSRPVPSQRATG